MVAVGLEHGGPYDVVLDCIGSSEALNDGIRLSESGGWVVLVAGPHHADLSFNYVEHRLREVAIIASRIYGEDFDDCLSLLAGDTLDLAPLLTHRYAIDDAVELNTIVKAVTRQRYKVVDSNGHILSIQLCLHRAFGRFDRSDVRFILIDHHSRSF